MIIAQPSGKIQVIFHTLSAFTNLIDLFRLSLIRTFRIRRKSLLLPGFIIPAVAIARQVDIAQNTFSFSQQILKRHQM